MIGSFRQRRDFPVSPGLEEPPACSFVGFEEVQQQRSGFPGAASLGCRRSARTSLSVQTNPSSLRGELPRAHRYGPHSTSGALTSPRSGSKFSWASPLTWLCTTQRVAKPDS